MLASAKISVKALRKKKAGDIRCSHLQRYFCAARIKKRATYKYVSVSVSVSRTRSRDVHRYITKPNNQLNLQEESDMLRTIPCYCRIHSRSLSTPWRHYSTTTKSVYPNFKKLRGSWSTNLRNVDSECVIYCSIPFRNATGKSATIHGQGCRTSLYYSKLFGTHLGQPFVNEEFLASITLFRCIFPCVGGECRDRSWYNNWGRTGQSPSPSLNSA